MRRPIAALLALALLWVTTVNGALASGEKSETIELSLIHLQDASLMRDAIEDSVARFAQDHPGVRVNLSVLVNDVYKRRIAVAAATDTLPDIFVTWGGSMLEDYVGLGKVRDLSALMSAGGYDERFYPEALRYVRFQDAIWGVPVENLALGMVFYNKSIFEKLGLEPPATYEQLLGLVEALKAKNILPFALANRSGWAGSMYYMYFVDRLGGAQALDQALRRNPDGTPADGMGFANPVFMEAWRMLRELIQREAFPPDVNLLEEDTGDARELLYQGEAAMMLMGSWLISSVRSENPEFLKNLGFFPFPSLGAEAPGDRLIGTLGDNFYSVSSRCEHPELAFELIQYLIDDQAVRLRMQGGKLPPVRQSLLDAAQLDPMVRQLLNYVENAQRVQLWYDQVLPPKLAEAHKQICREVFAGLSPQEATRRMIDAEKEYYDVPTP